MEDLKKHKVAIIHQGFIPIYRVPFFNGLADKNDNKYVVFHGRPPGNSGDVENKEKLNFNNEKIYNIEISIFGKKIVYQSLILKVIFGNFDAIIIGHEVKFVSSIFLAIIFKIIGRPVIWWGHGFEKGNNNGGHRLLFKKLKAFIANIGDGYLVYTNSGSKRLCHDGFKPDRVYIVRNTLDVESQIVMYHRSLEIEKSRLFNIFGLDGDIPVVIYLGRLYRDKRVDKFVEIVKNLNSRGLRCNGIIIGDGPDMPLIKNLSKGNPNIHIKGAIADQQLISDYLRIASMVLVPGKVGLVANHALAHGTPVVTLQSDKHAPEIDYIIHGFNGLIVSGDFVDLQEQVADLLENPNELKNLSLGALKSREELTLKYMVDKFDSSVSEILKSRKNNGEKL